MLCSAYILPWSIPDSTSECINDLNLSPLPKDSQHVGFFWVREILTGGDRKLSNNTKSPLNNRYRIWRQNRNKSRPCMDIRWSSNFNETKVILVLRVLIRPWIEEGDDDELVHCPIGGTPRKPHFVVFLMRSIFRPLTTYSSCRKTPTCHQRQPIHQPAT